MEDKDRLSAFKAMLESYKTNSYDLEEPDGSFRPWRDLSAEGRLETITRDAAYYGVSFEQFAEAVRELVDNAAIEEAALRVVMRFGQASHDLENLSPDKGRSEPLMLVRRVDEQLNAESIEHQEEEWLTAEEQAALFKEMREDEAAGKREDAHRYEPGPVPLVDRFKDILDFKPDHTSKAPEWYRELGIAGKGMHRSGNDRPAGLGANVAKEERLAMHDDPAFHDLVAEIKTVVSRRYAQDPEPLWSPFYVMTSGDEPGFAFESLNRRDRLDLLADIVPWRNYGIKGITADQQRVVIANVLDGKPQQQWLDGVCDEAVLERHDRDSFKVREKLLEGISDVQGGKPPERRLEGARTLHDILHGDHPKQQEGKTQERGGRDI